MKKTGFVCVALALLESISAGEAWADRVGPRRHGHTHNPGFALGLGFLGGYGLGYYGRAPYFPPYYRYGPGYGFGPYGYPSYGFVPWHGFTPGYAYPPVVAVPSAPPVYIQQPQAVQPQPRTSSDYYWHYCRDPEGYYPYVKNCPEGWLQVSPQPNQ